MPTKKVPFNNFKISHSEFRYMICLTLFIVVVGIILALLVIGSLIASLDKIEKEIERKKRLEDTIQNHRVEHIVPHVEHFDRTIRTAAEGYLFKKLHGYRYWELRQQSAREAISSILPLFKERNLELPVPCHNTSIFSPVLFPNDDLKTPNSPDTLSTNEDPVLDCK